jgi:glycogen debranching enzyme
MTARRSVTMYRDVGVTNVSDPESPHLTREWLVTNGIGGYASGTIYGDITRRFHGMLVASLPAPLGRTMMLHHVAEVVRLPDGTSFALDAQRRPSPEGAGSAQAALLDFVMADGLPVWTFQVGPEHVLERSVARDARRPSSHVLAHRRRRPLRDRGPRRLPALATHGPG